MIGAVSGAETGRTWGQAGCPLVVAGDMEENMPFTEPAQGVPVLCLKARAFDGCCDDPPVREPRALRAPWLRSA